MELKISKDGSFSAFNAQYNECYHNLSDGALNETLYKHIIPAFAFIKNQNKKTINILDICFGLGYNTLATIYAANMCKFSGDIRICSPELNIISNLSQMPYPTQFENIKYILDSMNFKNNVFSFEDKQNLCTFSIEVCQINALDYIQRFESGFFDIIYQDAFSAKNNAELWTKSYFQKLHNISKNDCLITTYSRSKNVLEITKECNFKAYNVKNFKTRQSTLFSKNLLSESSLQITFKDIAKILNLELDSVEIMGIF